MEVIGVFLVLLILHELAHVCSIALQDGHKVMPLDNEPNVSSAYTYQYTKSWYFHL